MGTLYCVLAGAILSIGLPSSRAYDPLNGDFSRGDPLDIRIVAYNHNRSFIEDPSEDAAFNRILTTLDPDIISFEEFTSGVSQADVANRLNAIIPIGGSGWQIHFGLLGGIRTVIASRFPLTMTRVDTIPASSTRGITLALVDLPDATYPVDVYLLAVHLKCCGNPGGVEDQQRQASADAIANWLGDARGVARPSGDNIALPLNTPMIALGDFNLVGGPQPENTILTGDIQNTGTYGPAVQGDWDVSNLTNLMPADPFTGDTFTWQGNQNFPPSALDRFFYTDSVLTVANSFVLNTDTMTAAALNASGLQASDTLPGTTSDHLPIVMDFQTVAPITDCNGNGIPDDCDITAGTSRDCQPNGIPDECETDCNGNNIPDDCDIATGSSLDCQPNGIPDECEADCNGNNIPDDCDIAAGTSQDCNSNHVPDDCDVISGISQDCQSNGIPDECEVARTILYGGDRNGLLYTIDVNTGAGTLVGFLPFGMTEIEHDNITGRSFAQFPDGTFAGQEFDIDTAAAIGLSIPNGGSYTGLEYVGPTLYGTVILSPRGASSLRILNPFTGSSTFIGPTGVGPISGLAYEEATNTMYGIAGGPGPANLYTIDLSTGNATLVGTTSMQAGSLQFGPDGQLYAGGTGPDAGGLFVIDPVAAGSTLVGPTGFGRVTGLTLRIVPGGANDCNNNGAPDDCEDECNGNGIPDECDILSGTSPDCNGNGIPDECDIGSGFSQNCNGNGIPDECELFPAFTADSGPLSPIDAANPQSFLIASPPHADGDVTLAFSANADLDLNKEFIRVDINGTPAGIIFRSGASACPSSPDTDQLLVPAETYNTAVAGGNAVINMVASSSVEGLCLSSSIHVVVEYELDVSDCNANGIPDDCEPDGDGDGVINACDNCKRVANPDQADADGDGIGDACPLMPIQDFHPAPPPGGLKPLNSRSSQSSTDTSNDGETPASTGASNNDGASAPGIGMLTGSCAPMGAASMSMCLVGFLLMRWTRRSGKRPR